VKGKGCHALKKVESLRNPGEWWKEMMFLALSWTKTAE
jgi:hypothetical protein